ncbi:low-density lipoprotein receptor-related protein 12-like, partial [Acanthaster planci]|uniref:Low-density lipoprotein receptor-related protein 12-like n=1 Tax=Acanthaster planci TaxID=133434 RepID=A0A8B7XNQ2_ACAPL
PGPNSTCLKIFSVLLIFLYKAAECVNADCGQTLQEFRGNVTSPNYPGNYPNGEACKWHIPSAITEIVTIRFIYFNIVHSKNCEEDNLSIGSEGNVNVYCGSSLPQPFFSEEASTKIIISFLSNGRDSAKGFKIEYFRGDRHATRCDQNTEFHCSIGNCIPRSWMCNDVRECIDGSDESNSYCHQVTTSAYTTPPIECPNHQFFCYSVNHHLPICLEESSKCDGHKDCEDNRDEAPCSSVCKNFLKGTHGSFESPNFPAAYDPNLDCFWVLTVEEGKNIQLRFDVFDLEGKYDTDYVKVYDGPEVTDKLLGTYYGFTTSEGTKSIYMPPAVIDGSSNQLRVRFITDAISSNKGFNATFQTKGVCLRDQFLCSNEDKNCYDARQRCDGIMACIRGQDELGCSDTCKDQISCSLKSPSARDCFTMEERCDGKRDCTNNVDEKLCDPSLCMADKGLFRCNDGTCIQEKYTCNSAVDCLHGEDEAICYASTNVVTAAAVGSIVCGLLLVAALSCTCKLYQLHVRERLPPSHMSPLREIEEELLRREAPPSYTATMASPHFDEAQRAFIEGIQAAVLARNDSRGSGRSSSGSRRQRSTFVRMLSRERMRNTDQTHIDQDDSTTPSQTETLPPSPDVESTTPPGETSHCENDPPPLRRISAEQSAPIVSPSPAEGVSHSDRDQEHDSASSCVSDTDSETNQDALHLAARDQQILRAAANIRRMRLAGGLQNVMQAQDHRAARNRSRTGSLVDQVPANSAPDEDSTIPTTDGNPKMVAAVGSTCESTSDETDTAAKGSGVTQDGTDEIQENFQDSHVSQGQDELEGRSTFETDNPQSPSETCAPDGRERSTQEEAAADRDLDEERLSHSSSILSVVSSSSENTPDDVPLLKP